jgi:serine O-acetyltransferase
MVEGTSVVKGEHMADAAAAAPPTPRERGTPSTGLWALIKEDWVSCGRDWTKPGFRALAVYRFGVWRMGVRPKILRAPFSILYRRWFRKVRNGYGIELPYSAIVGRGVVIEHQSCIVIHGSAVIGDGCIIRQGVTVGNRYVEKPLEAPVLGKNVNVGAGAKILGKVVIGDGAQIGANAVVLCDVPAGAIAVGIPARISWPKAKSGSSDGASV